MSRGMQWKARCFLDLLWHGSRADAGPSWWCRAALAEEEQVLAEAESALAESDAAMAAAGYRYNKTLTRCDAADSRADGLCLATSVGLDEYRPQFNAACLRLQ